jgi:hypothetical protein
MCSRTLRFYNHYQHPCCTLILILQYACCHPLQGIGMNVMAYDVAKNPAVEQMGVPYMSIEDMLPIADVVSLHVPLLPSTYHIMNKPRCALAAAAAAAAVCVAFSHAAHFNAKHDLASSLWRLLPQLCNCEECSRCCSTSYKAWCCFLPCVNHAAAL